MAAAGTSALQDAAAAQAAALTAERQCKAAEWQSEDEVRALRQQHETARQARLAAAAEQEAAKQAARGLLLTQELQAQEELLKVHNRLWQMRPVNLDPSLPACITATTLAGGMVMWLMVCDLQDQRIRCVRLLASRLPITCHKFERTRPMYIHCLYSSMLCNDGPIT